MEKYIKFGENEILLTDDEGNDMSLPKSEQIPKDFFKKGESVRAVIKEVNVKNNKANIVLSRIAPEFVRDYLKWRSLKFLMELSL